MAKRSGLRPADAQHVKMATGANERFSRYLLGALQNQGYDHLRRHVAADGKKPVTKSTLRDFADAHRILYQSLWSCVRGVTVPKDDFIIVLSEALGYRKKDEIALLLLIAHQARMPGTYGKYLEPQIAELAESTGLAPLVHGLK